jgi:nucleotide-binding universal stress UspA family protein
MKKILVGIDGSKESRQAAKLGADLSQATGSNLVLASAVYLIGGLGAPELEARMEEWEKEEKNRSLTMVKEIAAEVARPGLSIEPVIVTGPPAEALADLAHAPDVYLVVVGHRGRGATKRLLLGSVADRLVQICPKPIVVAR